MLTGEKRNIMLTQTKLPMAAIQTAHTDAVFKMSL